MEIFLKELIDTCEKLAKQFSCAQFDVFGFEKEDCAAGAKESQPFGLSAASKRSLCLRLWNANQQSGVVSTSNTTREGLEAAFQCALDAAEFCDEKYRYSMINSTGIFEYPSQSFPQAPIEQLALAATTAEQSILASHPSFKSVPYNKVAQNTLSRFYFNSSGLCRVQKNSTAYCYFYVLAQQEHRVPRQMGEFSMAPSFAKLDIDMCAKKAAEKTLACLNYEKLSSSKYPVLFSPKSFLDLLLAFANFFNAQNVLDQKSLCTKDSLNTKIASELLSIEDHPLHSANVAQPYFDEEGNECQSLSIIEQGVLKAFLQSSYTAALFQTKPTGHTSLGSKLSLAPHFLQVRRAGSFGAGAALCVQADFEQRPHVYIEEIKALHAGVNALQGSFSLPFDGFFVNNGKASSIEAATVAGDFLSLLQDIVYIGEQEEHTPQGLCPKIGVRALSLTGL